jgi:endogenous inhibitor of DNA gyrase (YacG/DUF329 family)
MTEAYCPICGKKLPETETATGQFYPFCSGNCRLVDLGHWFNQSYSIKNNEPETENTGE